MNSTSSSFGVSHDHGELRIESLPTAPDAPAPLTGFVAGITGGALVVAGVWGLHTISSGGVSLGSVVLLLAAFTALGKGISLAQRAVAPITAAAAAVAAAVPPPVRALAGVVVGAVGIWWVLRGHAATWWTHTTGSGTGWTLISALVQVAIIAVAGALLFGGAKSCVALMVSNSGNARGSVSQGRHHRDRWASWWSSRPGLGLMLLAGAVAIMAFSGYVVPRVSGWLLGEDPTAAVGAIVALLMAGLLANTWWWGALSGWWAWAHRPHTPGGGSTPMGQMHAGAAVVALLWFSATAFGLAVPDSYTGPGAMPRAHADCPPDCGGGSSGGSGSSGPAFPMQPPDMPNPPGGYNDGYYPGPDQGNGISIYNPGQQSAGSQGSYSQYPQQAQPGPPANGVQPPDYDAPLPSTAPVPQQAPAAPQQAAPAPQQPVQQAPAQPNPAQPVQQQPAVQPQVQQQPGLQQPQHPVNQPSPQQVQQQPSQNQQPTAPKREPDNTPVDPTDLAAAATRRGSQQAGQQTAQQGTQQASQQATKSADSARIVKESGDLFKQDGPKPDPWDPHPDYPGRTNNGKYGTGNSEDGKAAEKAALDKRQKDLGVTIIRDQVQATHPSVTRDNGALQNRYYDGLEPTSRPGEYIGVEAKTHEGVNLTKDQATFDAAVSRDSPAYATLNGQPIKIVGTDIAYPPEGWAPSQVPGPGNNPVPNWGTHTSLDDLAKSGDPELSNLGKF